MSKLSFRARALDASKPMPIYMAEELPDLPDYSAINRAVPQMPTGMEKEEECEHHLQRAICAGLIIPTPEVTGISDEEAYQKLYPANYKQPRQLIHMQPFTMEQDIIDYDMDSDDERWLMSQTQRLELTPLKFEEMMDKLEKSSGQTVVTLNEAKALLKEDDDLIIAVFDYWLNKRLKTQHPLILHVKTEHRQGTAANNPYIAFRRRTEKMQTRKNRKNDESSYEKMLKLRRDLSRAVTLLELIKRREKMKREYVHLTVEVVEKRYQAKDFSGSVIAELSAIKSSRPAFTPIFHNHYNQSWSSKPILKDEIIPRKEKRQYKKRKHKSSNHRLGSGLLDFGNLSSDEELVPQHTSPEPDEVEDEGQFAFRRNKLCTYHMPQKTEGNWPWCSQAENGSSDKRYRYTLTSLAHPRRCIGFARRRVGRGGRVILDRVATNLDDFWRTVDFTIYDPKSTECKTSEIKEERSSDLNTNLVTNLGVGSHLNNNSNYLKIDVKNEVNRQDTNLRTSVSESVLSESSVIKQEPEDAVDEWSIPVEDNVMKEQQQEMVEFLQEVRRDWLHFRPKTPPPDYEPPCHLLPADDDIFVPSANTPFSLEIQMLEAPSALLDTSNFVTAPFSLEEMISSNSMDVPVTDTRQISDTNVQTGINLNVNVGLNTLTTSVNNSFTSNISLMNDDDDSTILSDTHGVHFDGDRTIGCSVFSVSNISESADEQHDKHSILSNTLTSPKINSVNVPIESRRKSASEMFNNVNGVLTQLGIDVSASDKLKNNRVHSYAYRNVGGNSSTPSNTLNIRTSTHSLNTLNSHSANILEIPLTNDQDTISHKQCTESGTTPPNNKNKAIIQKNNLVMEVT
ncbi:hypothetical protein RN001_001996 [Aquatica leii]|uniref:Enhancer of polycomb-like protein n=1 Tax=Aquatica leii TaxID=1421715 RepID=A0AAN7QAT6_9COLE|nr:hypothetical protein RN001_001996 [Aquatica leii]